MPRPAKLPEPEVLRKHREDGWTYRMIAEKYDVTIGAVQKRLTSSGHVKKQVNYREVVPWDIDPKFQGTGVMDRIRSVAKQKQGVPLTEREQRLLDEWLTAMAESMVVLDYHPDAPPNDASPKHGGFHYRTRVPADKHFWRDPAINVVLAREKKRAMQASGGRGRR